MFPGVFLARLLGVFLEVCMCCECECEFEVKFEDV